MNYAETLSYLYKNLPMFQRVGSVAYKRNLTNTIALCEVLDSPQNKFKSIHIAGTNGKGSSSHMLAAILQTAGYKTGLYTSPHLKEFSERIRINGEEISQDFVVDFVERIKPSIERIHPSFFEITVAMAFDYFAAQKIDIAVVETGLGGSLDSTNVITPLVSLITNISWDHKDLLGDTLEKIAFEKAGIIKQKVPVVISEVQSEIKHVFESKADNCKSKLIFGADRYKLKRLAPGRFELTHDQKRLNFELDLLGNYQGKNLTGVLSVIDQLKEQGFSITEEHIVSGLKKAATLTGLKGRWQKIGDNPTTICDTGHNEAGIREIINQLTELTYNKLHWVFGVVKDKDISAIINLLPKGAKYYFCQASIPRAMLATELQERASKAGLQGVVVRDVNDAIAQARAASSPMDLILVGGSTFVVAEINDL